MPKHGLSLLPPPPAPLESEPITQYIHRQYRQHMIAGRTPEMAWHYAELDASRFWEPIDVWAEADAMPETHEQAFGEMW